MTATDRSRGARVLVVIALFKLVKVCSLIALGIGALALARDRNSGTLDHLRRIAGELGFHPYSHVINRAFSAVLGVDRRHLEELGVVTFLYAAVFLTEGTGLLLRKRWAEYLTTIVTASFIPFELYELAHKPSLLKAVGIAVNAAIVAYLALRLWRERAGSSATADY